MRTPCFRLPPAFMLLGALVLGVAAAISTPPLQAQTPLEVQAQDSFRKTSGLSPDAYKILEGPLDESKLENLKIYGIDHLDKVRNKDGALVSENYGSFNGRITAVVKRNADTGKILDITINMSSGKGRSRYFWNVIAQSFTACIYGAKACKVTGIKQCKGDAAKYDQNLTNVCPFLAEIVLPPKPIAPEAAPAASPVPSPVPSHHTRLIFRPHP